MNKWRIPVQVTTVDLGYVVIEANTKEEAIAKVRAGEVYDQSQIDVEERESFDVEYFELHDYYNEPVKES